MTKPAKVKTILISQPKPENGKTVYDSLAERFKVKVDFRPFIHVEQVPGKILRRNRIHVLDHSAVIFNSRNAVDNFFRVCEELKVELPTDMKYFCLNESISTYIQKYTVLRKRKMFCGKGPEADLFRLIKNHKSEKFLFPCSDIRKPSIPNFLTENNIDYTEAVMYKTVSSDLSDLEDVYYDIIVFFSPAGIQSLFENFPDFEQDDTRIAGFGNTTRKAIEDADLVLNIGAPTQESPSMVSALETYIKVVNK
jgi:uroporphyrinogen-III synthase